jgi:hypothetical protein
LERSRAASPAFRSNMAYIVVIIRTIMAIAMTLPRFDLE